MNTLSRRNFLGTASGLGGVALLSAASAGPAIAAETSKKTPSISDDALDISSLERVTQEMLPPPLVPPHDQVAQGKPKVIEVRFVIEEKVLEIDDDGTLIRAMTYNGSVPGPIIVAHEGDYIELTLENPATNELAHNIDFHAATGALGGGKLTYIEPGEKVVLRFRATKPGVFVYHCAPGGIMIPWHVVSGMNGVVMVLPRDGLKDQLGQSVRYDRIYYIGEQDFYVPSGADGDYKRYASLSDSFDDTLKLMKGLTPSHVVFNGRAGSLTEDNAMTAKVGEKVLFIHSQANRDSRPHLIGGHGDLVWETGSFDVPPAVNLETWFIRGGSAGAALYTFRQPGLYAYVSHNLIEAFALGAAAHVKVEGKWNHDLMTQITPPVTI